MPARKRFTVTHSKREGDWTVSGSAKADARFRTKVEAIRAAVAEGRAHGNAQVVIKKRDGRIQSERTYGNDPRRSKG